jgi:hypothetical protein
MINSLKKTTLSRNLVTALAIALIGALALPALAAAQNVGPTDDQYQDTREAIAQLTANSGGDPADPSGTADSQIGSLPFSGLDVLGLFAIAVVVAGSGLLLQRAVRKQ